MSVSELKRCGIMLAMVCSTAVLFSLIWKVPYLYTVIGFAVWAFVGHLITIDDDVPGGWSNPDGSIPFPFTQLAIKAAVLLGLLGVILLMPTLRTLGA
ncbi:MAG: hypothetical protein JF619_04365 [Massilia sp.]|nr:hypothetical protein [Massilia sp.]